MGTIWGPSETGRTQVDPMLAPWTLRTWKVWKCLRKYLIILLYHHCENPGRGDTFFIFLNTLDGLITLGFLGATGHTICLRCIWTHNDNYYCMIDLPWHQNSCGQRGFHLEPPWPRWVPCWPHKPNYLGCSHLSGMVMLLEATVIVFGTCKRRPSVAVLNTLVMRDLLRLSIKSLV